MSENENNSRRMFLKKATKGTLVAADTHSVLAAETTKPTIIPSSAKEAHDRIHVAVLVFNGREKTHINKAMGLSDKATVEVAGLYDPDMVILQERANDFKKIW